MTIELHASLVMGTMNSVRPNLSDGEGHREGGQHMGRGTWRAQRGRAMGRGIEGERLGHGESEERLRVGEREERNWGRGREEGRERGTGNLELKAEASVLKVLRV